jgi:hypothetical protein
MCLFPSGETRCNGAVEKWGPFGVLSFLYGQFLAKLSLMEGQCREVIRQKIVDALAALLR